MTIYKLRNLFLEMFGMYRLRKILLNIFSYSLLITAGTKIIVPKLFELEWILFIVYTLFFLLFIYSNYYINNRKKIINAWYLLLVEKHRGSQYRKNAKWSRLIKLLVNINQYDNFQMHSHYQSNEQNLSKAFEAVIIFSFFVIFINLPLVEWLFWGIAFIIEVYFKIILHQNSKTHYVIKWMLLNSKHLLFFSNNESELQASNLIVNQIIKERKINKILELISQKYDRPVLEIQEKLLSNHKTSYHFRRNQKIKHELNEEKIDQLLNYDTKKLFKEFMNNEKFFKVISHKINYYN